MEIKKITKACFEEGQETAHARGLTQWDQGQFLEISGLNISNEIVEVHFSLDEYNGKAERMLGEVIDGVIHTKIPQFIMEGPEYCCGTSYNAYAWVYVSDEESAETIRKIELEIEGRSKPDEYVKPEELSFLQQLEAHINKKLDKSGHAPNMYLGTDENGYVVTKEGSGDSGGASITVDSDLSDTSTNPIQNQAVTKEFNKLGGTVEITDGEPTKESTVLTVNPNGDTVNIYTAEEVDVIKEELEAKVDTMFGTYVDEVAELIDENLALLGGGE